MHIAYQQTSYFFLIVAALAGVAGLSAMTPVLAQSEATNRSAVIYLRHF